MAANSSRPSDADLVGFLLGSLPADKVAAVSAWMTNSPDASETLHNLAAADTLTGALATSTQVMLPSAVITDRVVAAVAETLSRDGVAARPTLPGYRILRELGRGGMGVVYEAEDERLGRRVAIKVMGPAAAAKPEARERFLREARSVASLTHDHIVTILHVGEEAGVPYIAMPLLHGESLDDRLKSATPLPLTEAVRIARETAEGLAAAHAVSLIHRDIKPANLWLEGGRRVKILDFGLARSAQGGEALTQSGLIVGTPAYMAPEQAAGKKVDHRADLFSLGAVVYQLVTARRPFDGPDVMAVLSSLANETPATASTVNPAVPPALSELIERMLARDPARRPASAEAVARELGRIERASARPPAASNLTTEVMPASRPDGRKKSPRGALRVASGLIGLAAILTLVVIIIRDKNGKVVGKVEVPNDGSYQVVGSDPGDPPPKDRRFAWKLVPAGASPFDKLDPKQIPAAERFDWHQEQKLPLVAVIGSHRQRAITAVRGLACSPDGRSVTVGAWPYGAFVWRSGLDGPRTVLVGGDYQSIYLDATKVLSGDKAWDLSGAQPVEIGKLPLFAEGFSKSRDGKLVLAWPGYPSEPQLHLLDTTDLRHVRALPTIPGATSGSLSPDGKVVAAWNAKNKSVSIYDWDGKSLIRRSAAIQGIEESTHGSLSRVSFISNGRIVTTHADGIARIWDVSAVQPKEVDHTTIYSAGGFGYWAIPSADGKLVAICHEALVEVWQFDSDRLTLRTSFAMPALRTPNLQAAAFRTNDILITGHLNGAICQWYLTKKPAVEINPVLGGVSSGKFEVTPDGSTLIAIGENTRVQRFAFGGTVPKAVAIDDAVQGLNGYGTISPDASIVCHEGLVLRPMERALDWREMSAELRSSRCHVDFSTDGKHALLYANTRVAIVPFPGDFAKGGSEWAALPVGRKYQPILLPGGRHYVVDAGDDKLQLYTHSAGKIAKTDEVAIAKNYRGSVAASPDGKSLAVFADENRWFVIESDRLKRVKQPFSYWQLNDATGASFSRDNKMVVFYGPTIRVYDRETGKKLHEWKWPAPPYRAIFAPDGRHLLVNNFDGTLYILRLSQ